MKKVIIFFSFLACTFVFASNVSAQKPTDPQIQRDPVLEADANHNLEVAWQYYKLKKAYKAVLMRFEETYAAYPEYSKMDEFLFMAAMSSKYLAERKGKQELVLKTDEEKQKFAPEKLREDAVAYFSIIKDKYPKSKYIGETEKQLKLLQSAPKQ